MEVDFTKPATFKEAMVVEPLAATVSRAALVEEATTKIGVVVLALALLPWTTSMAVGVVELMPILVLDLTTKMEVPEEEARLNTSFVPAVPWMLKPMVEEVAFMPRTVPLLINLPVVKELVPFQMASKPLVPDPLSPDPAAAIVICPGVEVVMVMLLPASRLLTVA